MFSYASVHTFPRINNGHTRANPLQPNWLTPNIKEEPPRLTFSLSSPSSITFAMHEPVDLAKTHEILARFRPIAPKPQHPSSVISTPETLRPRPCRPRKRGRSSVHPTNRPNPSPAGFLPSPAPDPGHLVRTIHSPLVEKDLLRKLQEPAAKLVVPRPVRPVGSTIYVGHITELRPQTPPAAKRPEEVEDDLEADPLPAVVSGHNNRVRLANSRYKELVGQPECMWLDSMNSCEGGFGFGLRIDRLSSRRINGEVLLNFSGGDAGVLLASTPVAFSCRVRIEWACDGRRSFLDASCDVTRVYCDSKDYLFTWRFHIAEPYRTFCM